MSFSFGDSSNDSKDQVYNYASNLMSIRMFFLAEMQSRREIMNIFVNGSTKTGLIAFLIAHT